MGGWALGVPVTISAAPRGHVFMIYPKSVTVFTGNSSAGAEIRCFQGMSDVSVVVNADVPDRADLVTRSHGDLSRAARRS